MYKEQSIALLNDLKSSNQYREFKEINRIAGKYPSAYNFNNKINVFCSNDYLGMSQNKEVMLSMIDAIIKLGAGAGGSRNIGGSHKYFSMLENMLAEWHQKESALVFPTGYSSNDASIQCLLRKFPEMIVFSDSKNHASIINGIRSTKNQKIIFEHNNTYDLESKLKNYSKDTPKIIIFESIYSMDGDVAPIKEIVNLAIKYNALTFLDEVHAVGMYGKTGAGYAELLGISDKIDIIQSTMAKGIGIIGGYITGEKNIIDLIRSFSSGFIFTTALPPCIVAGCITSVNHIRNSNVERINLKEKTKYLREKLSEYNIPVLKESTTHIVPVIIGNSLKCKQASEKLLQEYNIYVQPINYPTVEKGTERFRINVTPNHTHKDIDHLCESIHSIFRELSI
ncbi:5-aminolevulinate synthase [Staphylococcus epidermidis]|uniref:5-aminolevulinate synthase n=1 Tax=Staphylococcus epidermidis TaxID=1282 RepID=UPI00138AEAD2|nr:5-aminolevulinate synthase [Staphylococcus epidermidis]MCG2184749.1 5-aminolevulinate synthase [Staphylococcus epidermidis]MDT0758853.1 5-aminolevulinate synthase [Staphylococcus epidermidis]